MNRAEKRQAKSEAAEARAKHKAKWADRLTRRRIRTARPAPKPKVQREKREPRVLARGDAAEILDALYAKVKP
jgi:hypothetical protein